MGLAKRRVGLGIALITLGIVFLLARVVGIGREGITAAIGITFLALYAFMKSYASLVAGGIMSGLGAGILYGARYDDTPVPILLGLGVGFLGIYAIDLAARRSAASRWPLLPGGILCAIALLLMADQRGKLGTLGNWWPILLIVIGLILLFRREREAAH